MDLSTNNIGWHRTRQWIDNVLTYLVQSGIINRDDSKGGVRYELNGTE